MTYNSQFIGMNFNSGLITLIYEKQILEIWYQHFFYYKYEKKNLSHIKLKLHEFHPADFRLVS